MYKNLILLGILSVLTVSCIATQSSGSLPTGNWETKAYSPEYGQFIVVIKNNNLVEITQDLKKCSLDSFGEIGACTNIALNNSQGTAVQSFTSSDNKKQVFKIRDTNYSVVLENNKITRILQNDLNGAVEHSIPVFYK